MKTQAEFDVCSPEYYGFGVGIMKKIKVCARCGASEPADRYICGQCGARLPEQTLFQRYQQMHKGCPVCDTVLTDEMKFCPHCGMNLEDEKNGEEFQRDSRSGIGAGAADAGERPCRPHARKQGRGG